MSLVSSCPACGKSITIPAHGKPHYRARCPLCAGEFLVEDALRLAPPQLELLDGDDAELNPATLNLGLVAEPAAIAAAAAGAALHESLAAPQASGFDAESSYDPLVEEANLNGAAVDVELGEFNADEFVAADNDLDQLTFDAPTADDDTLSAAMQTPGHTTEDDPFAEFAAEEVSTANREELSFEEPAATADEADEDMFSKSNEEEEAPTFGAVAAAAKRRKKEPSAVGTLIGVVGGGVIGTALAYFIVLWIGGPEKDFLELGRKLPKWMVPAAFHQPAAKVATPFNSTPSNNDINEMRTAANVSEPEIKTNAPALPDNGERKTMKLPFETEDEPATDEGKPSPSEKSPTEEGSPDDALNELANSATNIDPLMPADLNIKPATKDKPKGDTGKEEPALDEKEAATAETFALADAPSYSAADFQEALEKVEALHADLAEAVAKKSPDTKKIKGNYYRQLYHLAEVLTFTPATDTLDGDAFLTQLATDDAGHAEIGKAGMAWLRLEPAKRKGDTGVVLAGKVEAISRKHGATILKFAPLGGDSPVYVVSPQALTIQPGKNYLVCGAIVEGAAEKMPQLEIDAPTVVWLGDLLKAGG